MELQQACHTRSYYLYKHLIEPLLSFSPLGILQRWPHLKHLPSRIYPQPELPLSVSTPSKWASSTLTHSRSPNRPAASTVAHGQSLLYTASLQISFHNQLPLQLKALRRFPIAVGIKLSCPHLHGPVRSGPISPPLQSHSMPCPPRSSFSDLPSFPQTHPASSCRRGFASSSAYKAALPQLPMAAPSWQVSFPLQALPWTLMSQPSLPSLTPYSVSFPSQHLSMPITVLVIYLLAY